MSPMRRLRRVLAGPVGVVDLPQVLAGHRQRFSQIYALVRVFYALQLLHLVTALKSWNHWLDLESIDGLWPLAWGAGLPAPLLATQVVLIYGAGVFAALIWPHRWPARALLFVGLLERAALDNSFGKVDHGFHAWIYVSFVLIFLPDGSLSGLYRSISGRQRYLLVWAGAQAMLLMTYSLAGWWKIYYGIRQALHGQMGVFSPQGFSYMTADRLLQSNSDSVLGPLIIETPSLGWPLMLIGIYVEAMALVALFRPSLLRLWGVALASLHLGTLLVLTIGFDHNVMLGAVLLIASPVPRTSWRRMLRDLPLFGWLFGLRLLGRRFLGRRQTPTDEP